MAVTNYHTVNGEIIGETTSGTRTHYITDALGSVTARVDSTVAVAGTYRYKPYGDSLATTGYGTEPKFRWVGSLGYRFTNNVQSEYYIRARHNNAVTGSWTTSDPLWPFAHGYSYAGASPGSYSDPTGWYVDQEFAKNHGCGSSLDFFARSCTGLSKVMDQKKLTKCLASLLRSQPPAPLLAKAFELLAGLCNKKKVCVFCYSAGEATGTECKNLCDLATSGYLIMPVKDNVVVPKEVPSCATVQRAGAGEKNYDCQKWLSNAQNNCDCALMLCNDPCSQARFRDANDNNARHVFWHELSHCTGLGMQPPYVNSAGIKVTPHKDEGYLNDFVYALSCCLCKVEKGNDTQAQLWDCLDCRDFEKYWEVKL
jgi:hypothetical protein